MSGDRGFGGWLPPSGEEARTDPFGRELPKADPVDVATQPPADEQRQSWGPQPLVAGEPAEYGQRAQAALIDALIRLAIVGACVAAGAVGFAFGSNAGETTIGLGIVIGVLLSQFYAPIMIARHDGQTVGHRSSDTRVRNMDGSPLTFGKAFVREFFVKALLIEGIGSLTLYVLPLANYLWPAWDKRNEALHDKICSTRVVRG